MAQTSVQQSFNQALQQHQAGRLREAQQLYQQVLRQQPNHHGAMHYLGVLAHQQGRQAEAIDLIRRAIKLSPNLPEPYNNLGLALKEDGQFGEAIAAFGRALAIKPNYPSALYNLGVALQADGKTDDAIAAYRQSIALRSDYVEAYANLGNALAEKGRVDEAIAAINQAIALRPNSAQAYSNLGNVLRAKGALSEAIAAYRRAIALDPRLGEAHYNLGIALGDSGEVDAAIAAYIQALALRPDYAGAHYNLGIVFLERGQPNQAIATFQQAIRFDPKHAGAHYNLGNALNNAHRIDEAIAAYQQAIALKPDSAAAYNNLGNLLKDKGQLDDAIAAFRDAIARAPQEPEAHSNLLYTLHFHPGYTAEAIAEEHRRWNGQIELESASLRPSAAAYRNDRNPDRRLRVGYIAADFKDHCQSLFTLPLFRAHDREQVEIICYSNVARSDAVTEQLKGLAGEWRDIFGKPDESVARLISEDRIDVLVDLTMHMASNRLPVMARKPAPVQVCWLAYPASTGLTAIDYRLSDPYLDPPGCDESVYSEKTVRLPETFWCYDPMVGREVPVNSLPVRDNGLITFGSLNNFCKINDRVLVLWARVLRQVENSRLILLAYEGSHRQRTVDRLGDEGIDPARIEFASRQPRREYLKLYHGIDLGLDTFPYNGHTTSLDSFWMGVPVVTLVGKTAVSRAGLCQLSNLGLPELAADTPERFVKIAVELANDLPKLAELRAVLRQRMERSPLMDAPRFARNMEAAYRRMLRSWCGQSAT